MKIILLPLFLVFVFFGGALPASAETCSSTDTSCSEIGYKCLIPAKKSEGTCIPKTTCTSSDQTCPTGKHCVILPKQSQGTCADGAPPVDTDTDSPSASTNGLVNPLKAGSIEELLAIILHTLVQIGTIILILMLVWTGFMFVSAQGNEEKIRTARAALLWTVLGGLVLLGAEAISLVIKATVENL